MEREKKVERKIEKLMELLRELWEMSREDGMDLRGGDFAIGGDGLMVLNLDLKQV